MPGVDKREGKNAVNIYRRAHPKETKYENKVASYKYGLISTEENYYLVNYKPPKESR